MSLKMIFLGTGAAFTLGNYHSNVLLELNNESLLIDAGSDLRFSLNSLNKSHKDISSVYISHLHSDHIGGLEWLALRTFFDPSYSSKPTLFASEKIVNDLWSKSLRGGLSTLATEKAMLKTYFSVHSVDGSGSFNWQGIDFKLVQVIHIYDNFCLVPCFGLIFTYNSKRIFYTADTQFSLTQLIHFYNQADIIFHDCETLEFQTGVHAHYKELVQLPPEIKAKMWLYHYNPGPLPDAKKDGFLGFVQQGQSFEF